VNRTNWRLRFSSLSPGSRMTERMEHGGFLAGRVYIHFSRNSTRRVVLLTTDPERRSEGLLPALSGGSGSFTSQLSLGLECLVEIQWRRFLEVLRVNSGQMFEYLHVNQWAGLSDSTDLATPRWTVKIPGSPVVTYPYHGMLFNRWRALGGIRRGCLSDGIRRCQTWLRQGEPPRYPCTGVRRIVARVWWASLLQ